MDWEVPEPEHPWSTIGYWGDHQVVYLLRLLELSLAHHPDRVPALLEARRFTYADVPYRFRPFDEILANPRDTLVFDAERHQRILERVAALGGDGRLLPGPDGPVKVTLVEKLLVPALAKLSNLVPGAGIWMNTQRPEWNDANNALSGYGVSAVTLCHLDRYLEVLEALLGPRAGSRTPLSREVARWLEGIHEVLGAHRAVAYAEAVDDAARGAVMVALGRVAADYRARVYPQGFSGTELVPVEAILDLLQVARVFLAQAIRLARRPDGLFHAYQVLVPRGPGLGFGLETLPEMLEGQVAALATTHRRRPDRLHPPRRPLRQPPLPRRPGELPPLPRPAPPDVPGEEPGPRGHGRRLPGPHGACSARARDGSSAGTPPGRCASPRSW